jgi:hypothetical protein
MKFGILSEVFSAEKMRQKVGLHAYNAKYAQAERGGIHGFLQAAKSYFKYFAFLY